MQVRFHTKTINPKGRAKIHNVKQAEVRGQAIRQIRQIRQNKARQRDEVVNENKVNTRKTNTGSQLSLQRTDHLSV